MSLDLNSRLRCIGVRLSTASRADQEECDIEETLLDGILEARSDYRLASVLFSWVQVHGNYVIVEKLGKRIRSRDLAQEPWVVAVAAFALSNGYHKWKKLTTRYPVPIYLMPRKISAAPIQSRGAEPWLEPYNLLLPKGSLRIRQGDVMSPEDLVRINRQYRNRYLYGPSWRADIISAIESGLATPTQIARATGCSYEPAHRILAEYRLASSQLSRSDRED